MVQLFSGGAPVASVQSTPEPCYGGPPGSAAGSSASGGKPWAGYTDGRLNPHPAEYYSIYCDLQFDQGLRQARLVERIPLELVKAEYTRNQVRVGRRPPPPDQICPANKNSGGVIVR